RSVLKRLGAGAGIFGGLISGGFDATAKQRDRLTSQVASNDPMKITRVEAIHFSPKINVGGGSGGSGAAEFCWVRLHTDAGIVGVGETYPFSNGELGALKDYT